MICGMPPEDGGRLLGVLPGGVAQLARARRSGRRRCFITPRLADTRASVKWSAQPKRSEGSQPQAARRVSKAKQSSVQFVGLETLVPHRGLCGPL